MGENFLTDQVAKAARRRDLSKLDQGAPKLFERADIIDIVYDGIALDGHSFEEGERLLARAADQDNAVDLIRCNRRVGRIEGDDAKRLHAELKNPENLKLVRVRMSNVSKLSRGADATINKE